MYRAAEKKILQNREQMNSAERRAWEICSRRYFEYTSEFQDKLWEENEELACRMADIEKALEHIPNGCGKDILRERYINGKKWNEITEIMCYSEQHVHRLHKKALDMVIVPIKYR